MVWHEDPQRIELNPSGPDGPPNMTLKLTNTSLAALGRLFAA
jgi:hypothetical protein